MGQSYAKLYLMGATLSDKEYEDIPYPRVELTVHVTDKCFESGCILGTLSGTVATLARASNRNMTGFTSKVATHGSRIAVFGIFLGPLMTYGRIRNLENDAVKDRVYRLRHNRGQVRVDQASAAGLIAGPIVAKALGFPLLFGLVTGTAGGVAVMAVYNNKK